MTAMNTDDSNNNHSGGELDSKMNGKDNTSIEINR